MLWILWRELRRAFVAGWATSPIPAQGLERVGDQLLAQSEQQAGELIFDTVSGLITTTIGGVAVKWVGGKWVRAEGGTAKITGSIGAIADNEAGGFSYYDQFKKADGGWEWPKNLGFAEDPVKNTLPVGTRLDRYGGPDGSFLSPQGTPYDQRALAPGSRAGGYYEYEVLKPLPVIQGKIAPAFNEPGGGTQILPALSERVNVQWLIDNNFIKEVR
ncbi:TNT domain-containing protein [Pseudomonas cichorii]|nr:TNT domain-containing protein [Pseudomonas cichorii]